jgi:deoxyribodipyrimidine photolyase-related protein
LKVQTLRVVLGDQLSTSIAALSDIDPAHDVVLMAEVMGECTYVRHHAKKLVLVLSAMRHHAEALRARGLRVEYVALDAPGNTGSLSGEVARAARRLKPRRIVVTEPGEWRVLQDMLGWQAATGVEVEIRDDTRFLASRRDFRDWAAGKTTLRMEFFYREMRRRHRVLMHGDAPLGDRWNFDRENRKALPAKLRAPAIPDYPPDATTRAVMHLVAERFPDHFGSVERFAMPVTAAQAEDSAQVFFRERLAQFGDWQDAMRSGDATLFHSVLSASLNLGLLDPLALCRGAEAALEAGHAPLNAVEGFIRQILGWREFVRGIYWLHMPEYAQRNALGAARKLPWFYWSGETRMNCLHQAVRDTREKAHAHHIQRLMITGNFALLAGLDPDEVDEWYMIVYDDAYQWVELPNTRGMALFADGGTVGSKPYAASGAYINRMSDYCRGCAYDVRDATGPNACPFNALYWDFIARHADRFAANTRMAMPVRSLAKMAPERVMALRTRAAAFLAAMDRGEAV